jgi:hypothetical protein
VAAAAVVVAAVDVVAAAEDEDKRTQSGKTNEIESKYYDFVEILRDCLRDR